MKLFYSCDRSGNVGCRYFWSDPSGFRTINAKLKCLVSAAYQRDDYLIRGASGCWMDSTGYDILATEQPPATDSACQQALIQQLLTELFHLQPHRETQETPSYLLTVAKDEHRLKEVATPRFGVSTGPGRTQGRGADMETLAHVLAKHRARPVQDKAGLHGYYEFVMTWSPVGAQRNDSAPDLVTALQDQLGLKLQSSRSQVTVVVVERAEKPDAN